MSSNGIVATSSESKRKKKPFEFVFLAYHVFEAVLSFLFGIHLIGILQTKSECEWDWSKPVQLQLWKAIIILGVSFPEKMRKYEIHFPNWKECHSFLVEVGNGLYWNKFYHRLGLFCVMPFWVLTCYLS